MSKGSPATLDDDLVNVAVPRRFYALVIRTLADALASEASKQGESAPTGGSKPPAPPARDWTADEVRHLKRLVTNPTARMLMELACAEAGKRVSFKEVYERAGRSYGQARADLAGFTKLIRQRFDGLNWPLHVEQSADGTLTYDAAPEIAAAWTSFAK